VSLSAGLTYGVYRPILILLFALPVWGQGFHAGLKLGIPMTDYFDTGSTGSLHGGAVYSAGTRRYTLGISGEWRLSSRFGFEVDALYHRMGYTANVNFFDSASGNFSKSTAEVKGNSLDFPILAKYRFGRVVKPYVAAGGVLRHIGPVSETGEQTVGSLAANTSSTSPLNSAPSELRKRFYPGVTVAGGIEIGWGRLRVLPELRYTRWTANIAGPGGVLRFAPNQAEFLVGVLF
jgi:hypothetical protein